MLDEYEQNLIKEGENPGGGGGGGMRGRLRKWSLVRQPSVGGVQAGRGVLPVSGAGLRGALPFLPTQGRRAITTIGEEKEEKEEKVENEEGGPGRCRDGLQLKPAIFIFAVTWTMGEVV